MCKKSITFPFTVIECRNAGYVRNDLLGSKFWWIKGDRNIGHTVLPGVYNWHPFGDDDIQDHGHWNRNGL